MRPSFQVNSDVGVPYYQQSVQPGQYPYDQQMYQQQPQYYQTYEQAYYQQQEWQQQQQQQQQARHQQQQAGPSTQWQQPRRQPAYSKPSRNSNQQNDGQPRHSQQQQWQQQPQQQEQQQQQQPHWLPQHQAQQHASQQPQLSSQQPQQHAGWQQQQQPRQPQRPPATHYSIDVECVATGTDHNSRAVAQISLVDQYEQVILNLYVRPEQPVVSYLSPLTGLSAELLDTHGVPLDQAVATLRAALPKTAVLVGQNIGKDMEWLGLKEGVDFASLMDLAGLYRIWNEKFNSWSVFGQSHVARVLLDWKDPAADGSGASEHDAVSDAIKSVRLFNYHQKLAAEDPQKLEAAKKSLLEAPIEPPFARRHPTFEGVCMGNRKACSCGAPFFGG